MAFTISVKLALIFVVAVPLLALAQCSLVLLSAVPHPARSTSARACEAPAAVVAVQVAAVELPPVVVAAVPLLVLQLLRAVVLLLRACSQRVLVLRQVVPVQL